MTGYVGINNKAQKIKNVYFGLNNVARKVKKGYIGVNGVAQLWYTSQREWVWDVYESSYITVEGTSTSDSSSSAFYAGTSYTLSQSTGQFSVDQTTQIARSSTGATNAVGKYYIDLYSSGGTYTGGTVYLITAASYSWLTGLSLTVTPITSQIYKGSLVGTAVNVDVSTYPVDGKQGNYWYVLRSDIAHMVISYTGSYTDQIVQMDSGGYRLLTLTSGGTLTLAQSTTVDIWMCGAGERGHKENSSYMPYGGGGGGHSSSLNDVDINNLTIVIGAASTSPGGYSRLTGSVGLQTNGGGTSDTGEETDGGPGGSGGGAAAYSVAVGGAGDGISQIPFGDSYFPYAFCAGGGGGSNHTSYGGNGGENGSDGGRSQSGLGGHYAGDGGARGNGTLTINGTNATGYGSGGGGQGAYNNNQVSGDTSNHYTSPGNGYQGVCFIRIPLEERKSSLANYIQLEYVRSTGAQYIDTNIVPDANTKVDCDFALTEVGSSNAAIFGVAGQFSFRKFNATTFRTNGSNNVDFTNILPDTNRHTVTKTATSTTLTAVGVSDETKTTSAGSCSLNLSIFAQHNSASGHTNYSSIKLYRFRIYDGDILVRDFVPVKNTYNIVGLYDVINNRFYVSGSETALVAGPAIS